MATVTTVRVTTDEPIDTTDKLNSRLEQYRADEPDEFIVELGDIDRDTKLNTLLPYALGYMRSAGYGLTEIKFDVDNEEFHFKKTR